MRATFGSALFVLALIAGMLTSRPAMALGTVCSFAGPTLTLGSINPFAGFPYTTSGNIGVTCINLDRVATTAYVCLSISATPSGLTAVGSARVLPIQFTGGANWPSQIGDGTTAPMAGPFAFSVAGGSATAGLLPLVTRLLDPGAAPLPGAYISVLSGTSAQAFYTTGSTAPSSCAALIAGASSVASVGVSVLATVLTLCTVSTSPLTFPTRSLLTSTATATATISTVCNTPLSISIGLDNGASGTGPTNRFMRSSGNAISYGIYRDAAMTQPWGDVTGTTATINPGLTSVTAYGLVPIQPSPVPGTYTDVVNVTVSY